MSDARTAIAEAIANGRDLVAAARARADDPRYDSEWVGFPVADLDALLDVAEAAVGVADDAGVEFEDPRITYRSMQITRIVWDDLVAALDRLAGTGEP